MPAYNAGMHATAYMEAAIWRYCNVANWVTWIYDPKCMPYQGKKC